MKIETIVIRVRRGSENFPVPHDTTHRIETACFGPDPRGCSGKWEFDVTQHRSIRDARIYANGINAGAMRFQNDMARIELAAELQDIAA